MTASLMPRAPMAASVIAAMASGCPTAGSCGEVDQGIFWLTEAEFQDLAVDADGNLDPSDCLERCMAAGVAGNTDETCVYMGLDGSGTLHGFWCELYTGCR